MTDWTDEATIAEERARELSLSKIVRYSGTSLRECSDCGIDIPEARRQSIKGCTRCADCQGAEEMRTRR